MKSWKTRREALCRRIRMAAEQLDLPEGMLAGQPQLSLDGGRQLLVEQHQGIVEYGDQRIRIAAKPFIIEVVGEGLCLVAMDRDGLRIQGTIRGLSYLEGRGR